MPLHEFERQELAEIKCDLEAAARWIGEIIKEDELDTDSTLVNAALAGSYTGSAHRRIGVVIDAIDIPEGESEFDPPVEEELGGDRNC